MNGATVRTTRIGPLGPGPGMPRLPVSDPHVRPLATGSWRTVRPERIERASPCQIDCPAGTDVRAVLALTAEGDLESAWRLLVSTNPLPGVCSRVCYRPCEAGCNRAALDGSVGVHLVERALADEARARRLMPAPAAASRTGHFVAVVGAGPAGLACAWHLARAGHSVALLDAMPKPGGMLRYGIPPFRLPRAVLDAECALIEQAGIRFEGNRHVDRRDASLAIYDAIVLAPGLQQPKRLSFPGAHLPGVRSALAFLRDANVRSLRPLNGHVVVIGGGNTAIDAARVARRLGAEATVVYRRARTDMPAHPAELAEAEAEGVRIVCHAQPVQVLAASDRVSGVEFQRTRPGRPDATGRPRPEPIRGDVFVLPAAEVLIAIGEELEPGFFEREIDRVDERLGADPWGRTDRHAIFVTGDAATGLGTVAAAIGSGRRAALAVDAFLRGTDPVAARFAERATRAHLNLFTIPKRPPARAPSLPPTLALAGFDEVASGLSWPAAVEEARRCLVCGSCNACGTCARFCPDAAIEVDPLGAHYDLARCKGCGLCAAECPRGAVRLVAEEAR